MVRKAKANTKAKVKANPAFLVENTMAGIDSISLARTASECYAAFAVPTIISDMLALNEPLQTHLQHSLKMLGPSSTISIT